MYETPSQKFWNIIATLVYKYLVWIVIISVIIIWLFFPDLTEMLGQIVLFWAPLIVLIGSLIIGLTKTRFDLKRKEEQGISQYDITISKFDFYIVDLLIYGGAVLILLVAFIFNQSGINIIDLLQALIYFVFANLLKQIFYKKIIK